MMENISSNNAKLLKVRMKMLGNNYIMQLKTQFNSTMVSHHSFSECQSKLLPVFVSDLL